MNQLRSYSIVTGAYWSFMLTDGALRMLVLLYFHEQGFSPITLAFLFLLYEFFGVVTNLFGGWIADKKGLKSTLIYGLVLQPIALIALSFVEYDWKASLAIPLIMVIQAFSGIAKDLTKMSSKTAVKFLVPEGKNSTLFKWVAVLTGSKNAIKGLGFFVGGYLLQKFGFAHALWILAGLVVVALLFSLLFLPKEIGKVNRTSKFSSILKQNKNIKKLSFARIFLFGARDIWFVVAIPLYFTSVFQWSFSEVGTFMAFWVVGYGIIQSFSPQILKNFLKSSVPTGKEATFIALLLASVL
jgi:MFS family permease